MTNYKPAYFAAFLLCAMGVWGCSQQRTGAISAKINELETRYAKLEQDYRTLHVSFDQQKKKLTQIEANRVALEKDKAALQDQLQGVRGERETLKKQVAERTQERDVAHNNLVQFGKELQGLAGRFEAAMSSNAPSQNASIVPVSRRGE